MKYQNKRGGRLVLQDIKKPEREEWGTSLQAMQVSISVKSGKWGPGPSHNHSHYICIVKCYGVPQVTAYEINFGEQTSFTNSSS